MEELSTKMLAMRLKGMCCSQILLQLGIETKEGENQGLIDASAALCNGFYEGKLCGALSGGACLMSYLDVKKAIEKGGIQELFEWFEGALGTTECEDILASDPLAKMQLCPQLIEQTYEKVLEILDEI